TGAAQPLHQLLGIDQAETLHFVDQLAGDREAAVVEADGADATAAVALGGDLPRRGAAHQAHAAEVLLQRIAQGRQIVFGRAEEQHETEVRMDQLARQVLGHRLDQPRFGHCRAYHLRLLFTHAPSSRPIRIGLTPFLVRACGTKMLLEYRNGPAWVAMPGQVVTRRGWRNTKKAGPLAGTSLCAACRAQKLSAAPTAKVRVSSSTALVLRPAISNSLSSATSLRLSLMSWNSAMPRVS